MKTTIPISKVTILALATLLFASGSWANSELLKLQKDPNQWVMWGGDYGGNRYSELNQITNKNVADMQVAWTMSTGVFAGP